MFFDDCADRHPGLDYADLDESDDRPPLTPYHTIPGRDGVVTLPQRLKVTKWDEPLE
jgi:hypothetical protein